MTATWRHPLRRYIDKLKDIRTSLLNPATFYTAKREDYLALAQRVAHGVLAVGRPAEIEQEEWEFRIQMIVAEIGAVLVSGEETGLSIFLAVQRDTQGQIEEFTGPTPGIYAKDTVLNWVQAGRKEDPLGKQFDDSDWGKSDQAITNRVWWALYTGRSRNSEELIRRYLVGKTQDAVMALLPAVLKAWQENFAVRVREDWRAWLRSVIANPR